LYRVRQLVFWWEGPIAQGRRFSVQSGQSGAEEHDRALVAPSRARQKMEKDGFSFFPSVCWSGPVSVARDCGRERGGRSARVNEKYNQSFEKRKQGSHDRCPKRELVQRRHELANCWNGWSCWSVFKVNTSYVSV